MAVHGTIFRMTDCKATSHSAIEQTLKFLREHAPLVVTGHVRPDGDALGSALALARLLNLQGIEAVASAYPDELGAPGFLEGSELIVPPSVAAVNCRALVAVDCGSVDRLPESFQPLVGKVPVLNIDHHRTNSRFGAVNWIEDRASSTGELIWRLSRRAGWHLDRAVAEALWVALITDTGRFAYDQTRPRTLICAAALLRHGVRTAMINDRIYGTFPRRVMEIKRRAYNALTFWREGEVALVTLSYADFVAAGCTKADAEDVIEIPRALEGSRVAFFFYETEPDSRFTRVSIRTRAPLDATVLASQFGGGGHDRAAGCNISQPLQQAVATMREAVNEWLDSIPSDALQN